jgi:antirestriction protein
MNDTKIFLNTWGAYNNGCIGYGWMTPDEARNFIEEDEERDGGEWFIADIDNYLGIGFSNLDYCNVTDVIDTIETLENMHDWERDEIIAIMEYRSTDDVQDAIDARDSYIIYCDVESYLDSCDELLDFNGNDFMERYFDYEAYHRDCMFDVYEAENGVVIVE